MTAETQEPVILREILAEMPDEKVRALLDACTPGVTEFPTWLATVTPRAVTEDIEDIEEPTPEDEPAEDEDTD